MNGPRAAVRATVNSELGIYLGVLWPQLVTKIIELLHNHDMNQTYQIDQAD